MQSNVATGMVGIVGLADLESIYVWTNLLKPHVLLLVNQVTHTSKAAWLLAAICNLHKLWKNGDPKRQFEIWAHGEWRWIQGVQCPEPPRWILHPMQCSTLSWVAVVLEASMEFQVPKVWGEVDCQLCDQWLFILAWKACGNWKVGAGSATMLQIMAQLCDHFWRLLHSCLVWKSIACRMGVHVSYDGPLNQASLWTCVYTIIIQVHFQSGQCVACQWVWLHVSNMFKPCGLWVAILAVLGLARSWTLNSAIIKPIGFCCCDTVGDCKSLCFLQSYMGFWYFDIVGDYQDCSFQANGLMTSSHCWGHARSWDLSCFISKPVGFSQNQWVFAVATWKHSCFRMSLVHGTTAPLKIKVFYACV